MAAAACVLVAVPLAFAGGTGPGQLLAAIKICLLVLGVALFGAGAGCFVAARRQWPRRWPSAATGVVIAMSALYAVYIWLALASLGKWSF